LVLDAKLALVFAIEREAFAKICDDKHHAWRWDEKPDSASGPRDCAAAIRATMYDAGSPAVSALETIVAQLELLVWKLAYAAGAAAGAASEDNIIIRNAVRDELTMSRFDFIRLREADRALARAAEREKCAKKCESYIATEIGKEMADAIRAMGNE
jgi:hypothetical protein